MRLTALRFTVSPPSTASALRRGRPNNAMTPRATARRSSLGHAGLKAKQATLLAEPRQPKRRPARRSGASKSATDSGGKKNLMIATEALRKTLRMSLTLGACPKASSTLGGPDHVAGTIRPTLYSK